MKSKSATAHPLAAKSASKRVYLELRQRIIDMSLLPGTKIASFRKIADEAAYLVALVHEYQRRGFFDAPSTSPLLDMDFPETLENLAAMLGTRGYMEPYTREDGRYGTWYGDCR